MKGFRTFIKTIAVSNPFRNLLACFLGLLAILFAAGLYGVSSYIISLAALHPSFAALMVPAVTVRFLGIGRAVLSYSERLASHDQAFRILKKIRVCVYDKLEPVLLYETSETRGQSLSKVITDVENLQDGILRIAYPLAVSAFTIIVGSVLAYFFNPLLALVFFLLACPIPFVAFGLILLITGKRERSLNESKQALYNDFIEISSGIIDIKTNTQEAARKESFKNSLYENTKAQIMRSKAAALGEAAAALYSGLSTAVLLGSAAFLAVTDRINPLYIAASVICLLYFLEPISQLHTISSSFEKVRSSADRTLGAAKPTVSETTAPDIKDVDGIMEMQRLSFSYGLRSVLDDFSLNIQKGRLSVLMGSSGSGKSTAVNLLLGLIKPDKGHITLNGFDLSQLSLENRLKLFSVAEQNPHFFNDTIRANLLTTEDIGDGDIYRILDRVGLKNHIDSLPQGLDTLLYEDGANFSGGELKRLSIARALLRQAPFYIFDEPSAGLDTFNERKILELIFSLSANKGVLLITHRTGGLNYSSNIDKNIYTIAHS